MLKLLVPLPRKITIAFSGGVDSVAITDFLRRKHEVTCAFFHHGTENSDRAFNFVGKFCHQYDLTLMVGFLQGEKPKELSTEEFWRNKRYEFLCKDTMGPVVTAHHLDDCVETYLWSCIHGTPKVIPMIRENVIRPFLTTPKSELVSWCNRKGLAWCEDSSNQDEKYTRNYIRKNLVPHALKVNPGLHTVVKKIVEKNL